MFENRPFMKEIFQKYRAFLPLGITLMLFSGMGLLGWFGIMPFQRFIIEKADGIQEYYTTRESREQQMRRLPELQGQFESIQADEPILAILLSEDKVVDFVKTLEQLAEETKVQITIRSNGSTAIEDKKTVKAPAKKSTAPVTDGAAPEKEAKAVPSLIETLPMDRYLHVNVIVEGEYREIVTFLHKMETLPLGLDVIGVSMKLRTDEKEQAARPDNPGRNPFLILSGNDAALPAAPEAAPEAAPAGSLEATFDTVIYLAKQ